MSAPTFRVGRRNVDCVAWGTAIIILQLEAGLALITARGVFRRSCSAAPELQASSLMYFKPVVVYFATYFRRARPASVSRPAAAHAHAGAPHSDRGDLARASRFALLCLAFPAVDAQPRGDSELMHPCAAHVQRWLLSFLRGPIGPDYH